MQLFGTIKNPGDIILIIHSMACMGWIFPSLNIHALTKKKTQSNNMTYVEHITVEKQ